MKNLKLCENQISLQYLGQVGFLIKYHEKYILIDGYLSDYVDKNCCSENVKWVRRYAPPIDAKELDFVDYVFCTHMHYDHADPYTLTEIQEVNSKARFIVSEANTKTLESYGIEKERIIGLESDMEFFLEDGIFVTAIPAAHEEIHLNENGNALEVGFKFKLGDTTIFHGGDGCPYDGLEEKLEGTDVLILPVNGRDYYRTQVLDIIGCFDPTEAITVAKNIGADLLIPTHYDLYDVNCINPAEFTDRIFSLNPMQKFHMFTPGEYYIYVR